MSDIVSRPYKPDAACEACVFGRGEHAAWCPRPAADVAYIEILSDVAWKIALEASRCTCHIHLTASDCPVHSNTDIPHRWCK